MMASMRDCDCGEEPPVTPAMVGWIIVGFSLGLLVCWCCLLGRQVWTHVVSHLSKLLKRVRAAFRPDQVQPMTLDSPCGTEQSLEEPEEPSSHGATEEEQKVFAKRRWENVQFAMYHFSARAVPLLSLLLIASAFAGRRIGSYYYQTLYTTPLAEGLCVCVFFMAALVLKERLSMRAAEFVLIVLFQAMGVHGIFAGDVYTFVSYYHRLAIPSQMAICQLLASPRLVFLPNLLNFALQLIFMAVTPALRSQFGVNFVCFFLPFVLNWAASAGASAGLLAESKALVAGLQASLGEATAMSLLSAMCDCVVKLRPDLTLRGHFPKLDALLLREPRARREDEPFDKFVCPEDVPRFTEFVQKQSESPTTTAVIHLHMVDSMRNKVPVRIFHTCTVGFDGSLTHMLGLCDDSAEQRDAFSVPQTQTQAQPDANEPQHRAQDWQDFARILPPASPRAPSERSLGSNDPDVARVTVRATLSCQVLEECETSQLKFGFSGDSQLAFLSRFGKDARSVQGSLQTLHAIACASPSGPSREWHELGEVTVLNPATQLESKGLLKMRVVDVPPSARGRSHFELDYTDVHVLFKPQPQCHAPPKSRSEQAKRLKQRAEQAQMPPS